MKGVTEGKLGARRQAAGQRRKRPSRVLERRRIWEVGRRQLCGEKDGGGG